MPRGSQFSGVDLAGLVNLVVVLGVLFSPMIFCRRRGEDGNSDPDPGNGWGKRPPPPPPKPPAPPRGGIPLDDAQPARARLRGHERLFDSLPARARRRVREPERAPARTPARTRQSSRGADAPWSY